MEWKNRRIKGRNLLSLIKGSVPITKDAQDRISKNVLNEQGSVVESYQQNENDELELARTYTYFNQTNKPNDQALWGLVQSETVKNVASTGTNRDMVTTYSYEFTGGTQKVTSTTGGKSRVSHYNTLGQLDWDEDECGKRTDYAYDYQGRQTVTTYPQVAGESVRRTTENKYSCCHLEWTSDEEGNRTYYTYDGLGRVKETWTGVQGDENVYDPLVSYTYDGPFGAKDTVTTRVSEGGTIVPRTTVYNYDDMGRMSKIDYPFNSQPGDLLGSEEFLYDGLGRLAAKKNGEGKVTAYEYDHLNRVGKVSYDYGSFALPIAISSPDVSYLYKGNTSLVEHVDTKSEILGESGGDATRRASYTYYKDGRMKSYSPAVPAGYGSLEYTWNSIGQKTSMKVPAGVGNLARMLEYRYDSTGRQVGLDVRVSASVSSTGTAASVPGDTTRFFYDSSQNRTRLINKAGDVYQYVYDPTASFPAAVYEQGPEGRYVNVREPDGALVSREKYDGLGQRVANSIYHFDGLGSTRAISDGSGNITDTYSYDAWGNTTHTSGTTADNPYEYVGRYGYYSHYQEPDFHLLQLGVRYYDPGMGRFTQRDGVVYHLVTAYSYVFSQPLTQNDPSGLWPTIRYGPSCTRQIGNLSAIARDVEELMKDYFDSGHWKNPVIAPGVDLSRCDKTIFVRCWNGFCSGKKRRCGFGNAITDVADVSFDSGCPDPVCTLLHEIVHVCGLIGHKPDDWGRLNIPRCGNMWDLVKDDEKHR